MHPPPSIIVSEDVAPPDGPGLETIPGNFMMWIFILGDVLVFSGLLVGFCVAKRLNRPAFMDGQAMLKSRVAVLETLSLILSGWLAAIAVERQRHNLDSGLPLVGAMAFGILFLVFKGREYAHSIQIFDYETGFSQLYYLITGFHALHVLLGLILFSLSFLSSQNNIYRIMSGIGISQI